jgi:GNAT superfamily N-acetyltransferase
MGETSFKKLDLPGLRTLIHWAELEGWNPGPFDADVFWQADPDGFYGWFLDEEMIGGGSVVSYNGQFGFMGLFIVRPEYRHHGTGKNLWFKRRDLLLSRLHPGASIGMDGVLAMQDFYAAGGFQLAFREGRYERVGEAFSIDNHISPIESSDLVDVLTYDLKCFGFDRRTFMIALLNIPGALAIKYKTDDKLCGIAVLRKVKHGYKIGPLFADDVKIAEELYKSCLHAAIGEPVYLDAPMSNPAAMEMVEKYHAQYVFECGRMYYGQAPDLPISKIFGVTTFELG